MSERKPVAAFPRPRLMDDRRLLPIALLRAREAVMAYFRPHHRKGGVTEQQWRVIRVLYLDGEMDAAELARRSYLLAPSLSRILKDLEATGFLKRRPGERDSRQSLLSLSAKGSAVVTGAAPFLDRIHREIARRVGPGRVEELLALLDELERALADGPNARRDAEKNLARRRKRAT
jgi:homoprotocatechuate degradation regulator HpaR